MRHGLFARQHTRLSLILACAVLAITCAVRAPTLLAAGADVDYVIQPGDVLLVSVWREPDLQQTVLVRPDGGISFPLAGDLQAAGKTIAQVTEALTSKIVKYIPSPVVTVTLQENLGNRIYVTGKVAKPGVYLINQYVDVLQALSMAGGLTPFADRAKIKILRREGGGEQVLPFNYKQVEKGQGLEQNIRLRPGDTVLVP
ncbi:MAG: polysaccharide biosynthesis/export family protein [Caldilineaceae bacterium]